MIQEIAPKQYHVAFTPRPPQAGDPCLVFRDRTLLEREQGERLVLPTWGDLAGQTA